jgi:hypothetical protein
LWNDISSFNGFYIDTGVINIWKGIVRKGVQSFVNEIIVDAAMQNDDDSVPTTSLICQMWMFFKHALDRLSPLQIRLKDEIFIMRRKND